jgi:hypothetical protein
MPSVPGKTTWQIRGSTFQSEAGFGFGFAHRVKANMPLNIVGGYAMAAAARSTPLCRRWLRVLMLGSGENKLALIRAPAERSVPFSVGLGGKFRAVLLNCNARR